MVEPSYPLVELFSKPDCHLCEVAKAVLKSLQVRYPFILREIDITQEETLMAQFAEQIPVGFINGRKVFKYHVDQRQLERRLQRASNAPEGSLWQRLKASRSR